MTCWLRGNGRRTGATWKHGAALSRGGTGSAGTPELCHGKGRQGRSEPQAKDKTHVMLYTQR